MSSNSTQDTLSGLQELLVATVQLYETYFQMLEAAIKRTPDSAVDRLQELNAMATEGKEALEADMALFDNTIAKDVEGLHQIQDQLKIKSLHDKLKS